MAYALESAGLACARCEIGGGALLYELRPAAKKLMQAANTIPSIVEAMESLHCNMLFAAYRKNKHVKTASYTKSGTLCEIGGADEETKKEMEEFVR